jgi:FkbM family methyltransferase
MSGQTPRSFLAAAIGLSAIVPLGLVWRQAQIHHVSLVFSHYFAGRAGNCTLRQSFEGESISRLQQANFLQLSAASRVAESDGVYQQWSTPLGDYWVPKASGNALLYDLAEQKRNIYGTRIRSGDVVLDCGANVGVFVRKSLDAGAGKVIAIEPAPDNVECLHRNFPREIAAGRVVVYPKGVWDRDDVLKLAVDPGNSAKDSFVRPIAHANFVEAPLTTIDKLAAELNLPRVDFIKMDIEGAERKAIAGASRTIAQFHPRMALCIYHVGGDEVAIPRMVRALVPGYAVDQTCLCAVDRVEPEVALFH